jgi:hypothetical protein
MATAGARYLALTLLLVAGSLNTLWAFGDAIYNRPNALMDYVPQEIGVYDTVYWELEESDCRGCHGNSLADRHHLTDTVMVYRLCTPCHEPMSEPPFVVAIRDCLTGGCHSWEDLGTNGWHHNTDLSASGNCVACHDPNLIGEISPFRDFETYPPSIVTPTPFSCENCHWGQRRVSGTPGHPSTYDHYNRWGDFIGFYEYSNPIYDNFDTHHMGFEGKVSSECYYCHAQDPGRPDWNPYNPELIRYCEICHSAESLHGVRPHLQKTNGWEAVGFHVPGQPSNDPAVYRTWDPTGPFPPETEPGFTVDQMCFGCHGDGVTEPSAPDPCVGNVPVIDNTVAGIQPNHGTCGIVVTLRGQHFGPEQISGRKVQVRQKDGTIWIGDWRDMPIVSWADTRIEFHIPCWTFGPGNYRVQVDTECGTSNRVNFGLSDWVSVTSISEAGSSGPCGQWIKINGDGFGAVQSKIFGDGYSGVHCVVDFVGSQGTFTALNYRNWTSNSFEVRFFDFFEDGVDAYSGERNFVQDDGSLLCAEEPLIPKCASLALGPWSVYLKAIYFGDDDASGTLSCGDTIFQVVVSEPQTFELTNEPIVYRVSPNQIERGQRLRIIGLNFGPTQTDGQVRMGSEEDAQSSALGQGILLGMIKAWSNTRIKVKMPRVTVPKSWEGTTKFLWVEKDEKKSNYESLEILEPLP